MAGPGRSQKRDSPCRRLSFSACDRCRSGGMQVPHHDRFPRCRRKLETLGRPGKTVYGAARLDRHREQRLLGMDSIPERKRAIIAATCQVTGIGRSGQRSDGAVRGSQPPGRIQADRPPGDWPHTLAEHAIPEADHTIIAANRQLHANGSEGSSAHGQASVLVE